MDLFDQLSEGREEKALDRLSSMLAQFEAENEIEQDLALERASAYCDREWGSYAAGLEALALRVESRGNGSVDASLEALRLREEADNPGGIIAAIRRRRNRERGQLSERETVIALYGSEEAVAAPTAFESVFIHACDHLRDGASDSDDPFLPLAGWSLAWHDLPPSLRQAVSGAYPLPGTVQAARDECLRWETRLRHLELLFGCPGSGILPTACAARRKLVEEMWRKDLAAASLEDFAARLDYWAERGGEDGTGYVVLRRDLPVVTATLAVASPRESTKDRARRLKSENPDWSLARIGKQLGISRQAVHKHLKGFTLPV
ncbi:hypothetical protein A6A04_08885 [Paramagnetospirillum marisnigri]|uniref:Uncharacterized protein n=1 Tax=Paramagnetospirillum marisnigri TaxID=1285242 RepID=A0A178M6Y9_9PROT|nr:HTH domain-containing protein [Paramagnetospirillum marisnigri]OAN43987.1 hypothetical protein A6A04_08885 [Paramagnetospirillum marisnigri]